MYIIEIKKANGKFAPRNMSLYHVPVPSQFKDVVVVSLTAVMAPSKNDLAGNRLNRVEYGIRGHRNTTG